MNPTLRITVALCVFSICAASQAAVFTFEALLSGAAEDPPNASPGTGSALVTYDSDAHTLRVQVSFSDLTAGNSACHIHAATAAPGTGTAGVATTIPTFPGFPTGATSGTYDNTLDLTLASSFNPAFVTANGGTVAGAEAALVSALLAGKAYLNIHSLPDFARGEIRGFLTRVPDGGTTAGLLGLGLLGLAGLARRKPNRV